MTLKDCIDFIAAVTVTGSLMLFTPLWGPRLVYGGRSEHVTKQRLRFSLSDLACLFVYLGIANALFQLIRSEYRFFPTLSVLMPVLANLFAILAWILALRFADGWKVATTFERSLAMLIFFPLSAMAVAQILMCSLMLLSGIEAFSTGFIAGFNQYINSPISIAALGMILFGLLTIYTLRRSWRMVLSRKAEPSDAPQSRSRAF